MIHDGTPAEVSCVLCRAIGHNNPEIVERLIGTGIRLNEDPYALHLAVESLNSSLPRLDDPDQVKSRSSWSDEEDRQNLTVVHLLLQAGAQVTRNIFVSVCEANNAEAVELLLLKHGADAYIDQNTSDHLVAAAGNLDSATLNLLLDHRTNINGHDKSRGVCTPCSLFCAFACKQ